MSPLLGPLMGRRDDASRAARASRSHPRARAQRLEVLLGILGFFTLMALVQTVTYELQGRSAGGSALLLLALVVATALTYRARRRTGV